MMKNVADVSYGFVVCGLAYCRRRRFLWGEGASKGPLEGEKGKEYFGRESQREKKLTGLCVIQFDDLKTYI